MTYSLLDIIAQLNAIKKSLQEEQNYPRFQGNYSFLFFLTL